MANSESNKKIADRVSYGSIAANLALSLIKLVAGAVGHSRALVSDAVHSASDVFSTVVVLAGMHMSRKEADADHQYGHERLECVAANILACVLFATGLIIGYRGIVSIHSKAYLHAQAPAALTMYAALLSVAVKETMFQITKKAADTIHSVSMMADAWHHRSDAVSSIGAFIGVLAARMGFYMGDALASLVICIFILKAAVEIFIDSVSKLTDTSCDSQTEEEIRQCAVDTAGVVKVDSLKTRQFGNMIYVDIEISADGNLSLNDAHKIAELVHDNIEKLSPSIKHCMVHVNPI